MKPKNTERVIQSIKSHLLKLDPSGSEQEILKRLRGELRPTVEELIRRETLESSQDILKVTRKGHK